MTKEYYAHSLLGRPQEEWQPLEEHLGNVAEMAKGFAEDFGAGEWAYLAGLWHDLEKCSPPFQEMPYLINEENGKECLKIGEAIHV